MSDYCVTPPNVNRAKIKRPTKHTTTSDYRDHGHTTVNGVGNVGRVLRKGKHR